MTRDDIIRLAVEAKLVCHWDGGCASAWVEGHDLTPYLERFAALVAEREREACAKVCDEHAKRNYNWASENADTYHAQAHWAGRIAVAIRARGQE
jgi:coproporphyrinogen III oxidase